MERVPYIRLSSFYFFYFALLGALVPYWSLYLQSLSFDAATIGLVMATLHISRIFAPALWGWVADRSGERMRIIRLGAAATFVIYLLIFWQQSAVGIALVMLGYSFFWNAVLPQFEVVTLGHLKEQKHRYSQVRLWGSIGFILAVGGIGVVLEYIDIIWLPAILLSLIGLIWLTSLAVPEPERPEQLTLAPVSLLLLLRKPHIAAFFAITFFVQFSHGPYYTFYSVLLEDVGYSKTAIGLMWSIGVVAEVAVFAVMHRLIDRFGLRQIMLMSLVLCVLRWGIIGASPESLMLLVIAQCMHAATFGCLHAVGIALVNIYFTGNTKGRGQALFSSIGFGLGGTAGALCAGFLWEAGGVELTFYAASAAALCGLVLAFVWIWPEKAQ